MRSKAGESGEGDRVREDGTKGWMASFAFRRSSESRARRGRNHSTAATAAATQRLIRISFPVAACLTSAAVDPGPGPARERSQTDVHELRDGVGVVVILVCVGTA